MIDFILRSLVGIVIVVIGSAIIGLIVVAGIWLMNTSPDVLLILFIIFMGIAVGSAL